MAITRVGAGAYYGQAQRSPAPLPPVSYTMAIYHAMLWHRWYKAAAPLRHLLRQPNPWSSYSLAEWAVVLLMRAARERAG